MNILFIEIACDGTIGGSHTCLYNLVSHLDSSKYKSHIGFYEDNPYVNKFKKIGASVHIINRNPIIRGNVLIRKIRNWYRLVYKHRKEISTIIKINRIDLVVLNNTIRSSNDIIYICNKNSVPIIAYERGHLEYAKSDIKLTNSLFASIAVSKAIEDNMKSQKYNAAIRVIYDGLPIKGMPVHEDGWRIKDIKHEIDIPEDSIVIGIIGNIREWKGQEYFVRALLSLGDKYKNMYGLVIGGHAAEDEEYLNHLRTLAESSDACRRVKFLGFRDDIPKLLNIFDIFVHASIRPEPFGMVLLEAIQNNIPVIATNFGGPVEILANGSCGTLVPPRDENAIAQGIERYLNDPSFRAETVKKAFSRFESCFDLKKTVCQVEALFQEIESS
jgi:glycosyltransferase involved in cell wall biosynthesis